MKSLLLSVFIFWLVITIPVVIGSLCGYWGLRWEKKRNIQNVYLDKFQNSDESLPLDDLKLTNSIKE